MADILEVDSLSTDVVVESGAAGLRAAMSAGLSGLDVLSPSQDLVKGRVQRLVATYLQGHLGGIQADGQKIGRKDDHRSIQKAVELDFCAATRWVERRAENTRRLFIHERQVDHQWKSRES